MLENINYINNTKLMHSYNLKFINLGSTLDYHIEILKSIELRKLLLSVC